MQTTYEFNKGVWVFKVKVISWWLNTPGSGFRWAFSGPMVLWLNPANCAPGVHRGPIPGVSWEKHKKIFFSETIWPRAFICCLDQCIILSFINADNGAPGVHTRQVTIFQESARNHFREAGIVMQSYMVETVHQPFRNNSCLVCTPENDFYVNYRGQR